MDEALRQPENQAAESESGSEEREPVDDRPVDRRRMLLRGGKLLAYVTPVVLLYKPRAAFASGISSGG